MKSINIKLAMCTVAIAMLATPALAKTHQQTRDLQDYAGTGAIQQSQVPQYPNGGAGRTGTAESYQSGAEFNLGNY
jgi:hypothetical protein